eukprot:1178331-Amphidinium_carterae.1
MKTAVLEQAKVSFPCGTRTIGLSVLPGYPQGLQVKLPPLSSVTCLVPTLEPVPFQTFKCGLMFRFRSTRTTEHQTRGFLVPPSNSTHKYS